MSPNSLSEKQISIIAAAAELFDRDGYRKVSVGEIAAASGIKKPTFYHHFQSKEVMLYWIHEEFISFLLDRQRSRGARDLTPAAELTEVMTDILTIIQKKRGYVRVFFENMRELESAQHSAIVAKRDEYQERVENVIARGVDIGDFRRTDPQLAALAFFGMANWSYQWTSRFKVESVEVVTASLMDLLLSGLASADSKGDGA